MQLARARIVSSRVRRPIPRGRFARIWSRRSSRLSRRHDLPFGVLVVRVRARTNGAAPAGPLGAALAADRKRDASDRRGGGLGARRCDRLLSGYSGGGHPGARTAPPRRGRRASHRRGHGVVPRRRTDAGGRRRLRLRPRGRGRAGRRTSATRCHPDAIPERAPRRAGTNLPCGQARCSICSWSSRPRRSGFRCSRSIALVVKISDPRAPVFFVQERTGLGGERFRMYKFRTMVPEAELLKAELARAERAQLAGLQDRGPTRA